MKKLIAAITILMCGTAVYAGNPDRIGQAGAMQLNINGFGRSSGWGWSGVTNAVGLEAMFSNVGGLAYTDQTELIFSRTAWLVGSDINVNTFGFSQNLNGSGVLGVSIMSYDIGDIDITTFEQPGGGIGTYKPRFNNIALGYGRKFTNAISGGLVVKVFSEAITNAKAQGIAIDAGILYVTRTNREDDLKGDDLKFGVSLKNVGPDSRYSGDGLTVKMLNPINDVESTVSLRTAKFNLPALVNIGASYDMRLDRNEETYFHRLTTALTFTNNAFARNQVTLGLEYGYKGLFMIRAGHVYEQFIYQSENRTTAFTGLMGGFTFEVPIRSGSSTTFALDYSYRHSSPFSGSHSFGVRLNVGNKE